MDYFKDIYTSLYSIFVGLKITGSHLFEKKVTLQYPERDHPLRDGTMPMNARNRLYVDMERCDGCGTCARACPVNCIDVELVKVTPGDVIPMFYDGTPRKTWVTKYNIDFAKCCFCSLCTEACPTDAVQMTPVFEYSEYDRKNLLYKMASLSPEEAELKKQMWARYSTEKKKADAEAKAKTEAEAKAKADAVAKVEPVVEVVSKDPEDENSDCDRA